jgi:hypothetical protein
MITIGIAFAHAFRTNKGFSPELLYLGALYVDFLIAQAFFNAV